MNTGSIIEHIQNNPEVDQSKKEGYLQILSSPDVTKIEVNEILDELEDDIQGKVDDVYAGAGVKLDENNPEYKKQYQQMAGEIDAAAKEFSSSMDEIAGEMDGLEDKTAKEIDDIKIKSIMNSIGG
ncbi:MAG: hypothetical protein U0944_01905 [Candidatus Moranbacteria bacterium]|nr:hypothetical protein [Candidatus Moranbacteria bacterium]MDZ4385151.1 hypothetical protein [Candidatus Moranbacteria bacterium]